MTNCGELLITVSIGGLVRLVQQDDLKEVAARNFGKVQSDEQPDENEAVQCSPWKFFVLQRSNDSCKILMSAVMRKKVEDVIKGKKKPKSDVQDDEFNYQYRILILSILTNGLNSDSWLRNEFMYGNFKSSENIYPVNLMISSSPGGHFLSLSTTTSDDSCCSIYKLPSTMTEDQLDSNPSILAELKISSSAVGLFLSCSGSDDGAAEGVLLTVINKQKLVLEVYSLRKQIKIEETPVVPSKKASKGEEKKPEIIFPYVPYRKYRWQLSSTATCFTVSEDSSSLILGLCDGSVCMWDIRIGKSIGIISNHKSSISAICIVPSDDNMLIISGAVDGTLCYTTGDNIGTRIFKTVYFRHDLPCEPILAIKFCTGSGTVIVQYECSIVHCSLSGTLLGRLEAREGSHRAPVVLDFARYADVRVIENSESIPLSNMTPVFDAFSQSVVNEENQFFYVHLPNGLLCTLSKSKVGEIFLVEFDLRTTQDLNAELHPVVPSLHISSKKSLLNPVSAPCAYTLTENTLRVFENQINSTSTAGIKPATFFMSPSHLAKTNINTHRNMRSSRKLKVMKTLNNISDFL